MDISDRIQALRKMKGLSQEELAEKQAYRARRYLSGNYTQRFIGTRPLLE
ncbi:MAG: hypothetical protein ACOX8S_07620 [Christensenellales bacterium]|jgi:transcriptional regulator with XRE-family HTH domain